MTQKELLSKHGWVFARTWQPGTESMVFAIYRHPIHEGEIAIYHERDNGYWEHSPIVYPFGTDEEDFIYNGGWNDLIEFEMHLNNMDTNGLNPKDYEMR